MRTLLLLLLTALPALAEEGGIVSGRVIDEDGRPIAGAYVGYPRYAMAETDAGGRFSFRERSARRGTFCVGHIEFLTTEFTCPVPSSGNEIVLRRGLAITGRVAFPDGKPLAGAWVTYCPPQPWHVRRSLPIPAVKTGADGSFRISGLRAGGKFVLDCLGVRAVATAGDEAVQIRLETSVIRFSVRDAEGRPLRPYDVVASLRRGTRFLGTGRATWNGSGEFLIPVGTADHVLVSPVTHGEMPVAEVSTRGKPRLIRAAVTVRPLLRPARLSLRIRDEHGEVPDEVYMFLRNAAGAAPSGTERRRLNLKDGIAVLEGLPPGAYRLRVSPTFDEQSFRLGTGSEVTLAGGETTSVPVVLPLGGRLRVKLIGLSEREFFDGFWTLEIDPHAGSLGCWMPSLRLPGKWSEQTAPMRRGRYVVRIRRGDEVVAEKRVRIRACRLRCLRFAIRK